MYLFPKLGRSLRVWSTPDKRSNATLAINQSQSKISLIHCFLKLYQILILTETAPAGWDRAAWLIPINWYPHLHSSLFTLTGLEGVSLKGGEMKAYLRGSPSESLPNRLCTDRWLCSCANRNQFLWWLWQAGHIDECLRYYFWFCLMQQVAISTQCSRPRTDFLARVCFAWNRWYIGYLLSVCFIDIIRPYRAHSLHDCMIPDLYLYYSKAAWWRTVQQSSDRFTSLLRCVAFGSRPSCPTSLCIQSVLVLDSTASTNG